MTEEGYPTYLGVTCPKCQSTDWEVTGQRGSGLRAVSGGIGATVTAVKNAYSTKEQEKPLKAKCHQCKKRFPVQPVIATAEETLSAPAELELTREKHFAGSASANWILINGQIVTPIRNGETLLVQVWTRHIYLQLLDVVGQASAQYERFTVEPGEHYERALKIKPRWIL
ncbi:MAG: hypothetical protein LKJ69_04760 [Lactobacillus sp.]|jgi:Zn finger protein HypA/HybF involved in hydrogenase expression|nr:hypothetical protein [Lactobacillus sp.]MCI2032694.1 hypothetical protein [Lactobacillus sp.]